MRSAMILFTFDLDGVLHINPFQRKVFPEVCRRLLPAYLRKAPTEREERAEEGLSVHNHEAPADHFASDAERAVMRLIVAEARARLAAGRLVEAYDWDDIVRAVAAGLGYEETIDVRGLVEAACTLPYIGLHPYAREILAALKARGVRLVTLSNGFDVYQFPVLQALGIAEYFDARIAPDRVGEVKPSPGIFRRAATALGPDPDYVVHVGDSLIHDVFGAKRAGSLSVWVHPPLRDVLSGFPPWERPRAPAFAAVAERAFQRELNVPAYGIDRWDQAVPDYAVAHLKELEDVFEHLRRRRDYP